jgi:hypothetical protein
MLERLLERKKTAEGPVINIDHTPPHSITTTKVHYYRYIHVLSIYLFYYPSYRPATCPSTFPQSSQQTAAPFSPSTSIFDWLAFIGPLRLRWPRVQRDTAAVVG